MFLQDGDSPMDQVKFGEEYMDLDSWARKRQYDSLCQALGTGMNAHLRVRALRMRQTFVARTKCYVRSAVKDKPLNLCYRRTSWCATSSVSELRFPSDGLSPGSQRSNGSVVHSYTPIAKQIQRVDCNHACVLSDHPFTNEWKLIRSIVDVTRHRFLSQL